MKKLIIILFVLASIISKAQTIPIPLSNDVNDEFIKDTTIIIGALPANTGQLDTFGYVTSEYPSWVSNDAIVTMNQIDSLWNSRPYTKSVHREQILTNDITLKSVNVLEVKIKTDNRKWFAALKNRDGIILFQKATIVREVYKEKSDDGKFWYLYGEHIGKSEKEKSDFWNGEQLKEIKDNKLSAVVVTQKDSIK